jgi:hypothetical protein
LCVVQNLKHKKYPFALSLSKCRRNWRQGFDRLSPNGVGVVAIGAGTLEALIA